MEYSVSRVESDEDSKNKISHKNDLQIIYF